MMSIEASKLNAMAFQGRYLMILAVLGMASLSGCNLKQWARNGYKVGPAYCPPVEPVASNWIDYNDTRVISGPSDTYAWWTSFNDPALNQLIESAYLQNLSLREAGARIMEFRAQRNFTVGTLFPQFQQVDGGFTHYKLSSNVSNSSAQPDRKFDIVDVGLKATWELDFWGRYRRSIEAADAELDASIENYDDVLVLLLAEVATSYTELRTFQQRVKYARENVSSQEKSLKIAEDKFNSGAATERDVQQARTVLEDTRSTVFENEKGVRLANNQLCILLGGPPRDLAIEIGEAPIPTAAPEVAVGIPADLVRRRPDVRRAERELAAQSARIGIATSELYPHLGLQGSIGAASRNFNDLFDGSRSLTASVGPFFQWNLLNYGRLVSLIDVQDARFDQLLWAYQQQVLVAGREAEDGIVSFLQNQERVRSLAASANAAARTLEITNDQYRQGAVDFTAVFIASSVLATRQNQLAQAQGETAKSLIELYRALGGGWQLRMNPGESLNMVSVESQPSGPGGVSSESADGPMNQAASPQPDEPVTVSLAHPFDLNQSLEHSPSLVQYQSMEQPPSLE